MATAAALRPSPWRLVAWLSFVLVIAAVNYAAQLGGAEAPDDIAYRYSAAVAAVVQYGIFLGIALLIARGMPLRETLGLRPPTSWLRGIGMAGIALMAIWIAGAVLAPFLDATDEQNLVPDEWDSSRAGAFGAFFVVVTFLGPVVEEILFRGLGFALLTPYGNWLAILGTGVLFGLYHGLVLALPVLVVFGIAIGWLRAATNSLYPCIVLHMVFNGVALIVSVAVFG